MSKVKNREYVLTFFGCGNSKYAPGTVGSLAAVLFWFLVTNFVFLGKVSTITETVIWFLLSVFMYIYGVFAIPSYSKIFGVEDHSSIVLDEVLGQVVALSMSYPLVKSYYFAANYNIIIFHLIICFVLFRFFDIVKPSIIGTIDKNVKGGAGVMLDDLLCGIISGILAFGILTFIK